MPLDSGVMLQLVQKHVLRISDVKTIPYHTLLKVCRTHADKTYRVGRNQQRLAIIFRPKLQQA